MKTIYLDKDFKCHTTNDGTMTTIETVFFDDKCDTFIEGYRFVPQGETWVREDGTQFHGEMISPHKSYNELAAAQAQYEKTQAELNFAYIEGVNSI